MKVNKATFDGVLAKMLKAAPLPLGEISPKKKRTKTRARKPTR
jgi:hypothetical protein